MKKIFNSERELFLQKEEVYKIEDPYSCCNKTEALEYCPICYHLKSQVEKITNLQFLLKIIERDRKKNELNTKS
ncbi:hypothetical protein M0R19_04975 [Candidatus Pacearchaeota archaeon]|jgi:hypothetical protein|nr:hypothetical protein [Candidatus Pacearchaeota archaeon]